MTLHAAYRQAGPSRPKGIDQVAHLRAEHERCGNDEGYAPQLVPSCWMNGLFSQIGAIDNGTHTRRPPPVAYDDGWGALGAEGEECPPGQCAVMRGRRSSVGAGTIALVSPQPAPTLKDLRQVGINQDEGGL